jgi:hypothetical protein
VAGLGVDALDGADHLRGEQDVVHRDHLRQQVDARLVVDAGVEEDVVEQVVAQQGLLQLLRQPPVAAPVVGCGAAAVRDDELQRREVLEQVALDELHHGGGVGVDVVGAGGVEAGVATRADVDHRRDAVLDHLLVDRVPVAVGQRRFLPVAAGGVGVEVDADEAVFPDALLQLRDAGFRIDAGRLRQHGRADEVVREQLRDAEAQLVADRRPGGTDFEVANVVGHEAGTRREDGEVGAALPHLPKLVLLDGLAQLVVADLQFRCLGHQRRILDAGDLAVAPLFQRLGRGGVVAVDVDDHELTPGIFIRPAPCHGAAWRPWRRANA